MTYIHPSDNEPALPGEDGYLTDYHFDLVPHLSFGNCEGISLNLYLEGSFDASNNRSVSIGTFKTLRTDLEACRLMGALGGALMYYGCEYVNQEIHRYTPEPTEVSYSAVDGFPQRRVPHSPLPSGFDPASGDGSG